MSREELQRFFGDVRKDPGLLEELKRLAHDAEATMRWMEARSFGVTREEISVLLADQELSDDDLEQVAGGDAAWGGGPPPPTTPSGG